VGDLPGSQSEVGVAVLPEERKVGHKDMAMAGASALAGVAGGTAVAGRHGTTDSNTSSNSAGVGVADKFDGRSSAVQGQAREQQEKLGETKIT
jgi:hypothetical protein